MDSNPDKHKALVKGWRIFLFIYCVPVIGLCVYWNANDQFLPMYFCELQAGIFGGRCFVVINILATAFLFFLPVYIVKLIIQKMTGAKLPSVLNMGLPNKDTDRLQ